MITSQIQNITNIGAGTMGHAIALQFAMNGYPVHFYDRSQTGLERGMSQIKQDLDQFISAGIVTDHFDDILQRIKPTTDLKVALKDTDFVIESIVEDEAIKKQVWSEIEQAVRPETILATNTSGLSPSSLQSVLSHPERFVVAHFFNPAQLMPLVEIVPGNQTSQETVETTLALIKKIGKHAVPLKKEALGFVGNRIQLAVLREAFKIVNDGIASPAAVDEIVKYSLGRRWNLVGPIASADLGGLDIFDHISQYLYPDLANTNQEDPALAKKVAQNELGLKTGRGFFDWNGEEGHQMIVNRNQHLLKQLKDEQTHNEQL